MPFGAANSAGLASEEWNWQSWDHRSMGKENARQMQRSTNTRSAKIKKKEIILLNYRAFTSQSLKLKYGSMKKNFLQRVEKFI